MTAFTPGIELCRQFYGEVVAPILADAFPSLRYSAARIGDGSDVLGFDTEMSMDHGWGPSVILFVEPADIARIGRKAADVLSARLPPSFAGFSIRHVRCAAGTVTPREVDEVGGCVNVTVTSPARFVAEYLGWNVDAPLETADWLSFPEQKLLGITSGEVFHDGIGLHAVRARFAYYPRDVWLYLLAAVWNRIGQEEHLMGRAGFVGDEVGSAIIGSRLARDVMRLCFLIERKYAPYAKWFGSAFRRLECGPRLEPVLLRAVTAATWREREAALVEAYETVAAMQNASGVAALRSAAAVPFFDRPFRVIHLGAHFAQAIAEQIADPSVAQVARRRLIGGIDQISDNTDILCGTEWWHQIRAIYE